MDEKRRLVVLDSEPMPRVSLLMQSTDGLARNRVVRDERRPAPARPARPGWGYVGVV
jgi:hypothetical protein